MHSVKECDLRANKGWGDLPGTPRRMVGRRIKIEGNTIGKSGPLADKRVPKENYRARQQG